ncbi:MAG: hypothetical protein ABIH37_02975 [archaeon]
MKKGQTTIFIIIAIVIVAVIVFFIIYNNSNPDDISTLSFKKQTEIIDNQVRDCFEELHKEAINTVSLQGGYFYEPLSMYLKNDLNSIPFYYFGELEYIPEIILIQEQIALYIDSKKNNCFELIDTDIVEYDYSYSLSNISISEGNINIINNLNLILTQDNSTNIIDFSDSTINIKSKLYGINSLASYIAFSYDINKESVCISCIQEIAIDYELIVEFDDSLNNMLIVTIYDIKEENYPRFYNFALSATKDLEEINMLPVENNINYENDPSDFELNFNVSSFNEQ